MHSTYVKYVFDLYIHGKAKINNLEVEADSRCRRGQPTDTRNNISLADWIALASLRSDKNIALSYSQERDAIRDIMGKLSLYALISNWLINDVSTGIAGITTPGDMKNWFKLAGYSSETHGITLINSSTLRAVRESFTRSPYSYETGSPFPKPLNASGLNRLEEHCKFFTQGKNVCLFINGTPGSMIPDHWVVMSNTLRTSPKFHLPVYTWGEIHKHVSKRETTLETFQDNQYFGAVTAG